MGSPLEWTGPFYRCKRSLNSGRLLVRKDLALWSRLGPLSYSYSWVWVSRSPRNCVSRICNFESVVCACVCTLFWLFWPNSSLNAMICSPPAYWSNLALLTCTAKVQIVYCFCQWVSGSFGSALQLPAIEIHAGLQHSRCSGLWAVCFILSKIRFPDQIRFLQRTKPIGRCNSFIKLNVNVYVVLQIARDQVIGRSIEDRNQ